MAARNEPVALRDPPAYTVEGFCQAHHIGRSYFYWLLRRGRGPEIYKLGRRTYVSGEAAAEWRRRMEQETRQCLSPGERRGS